MVDTSKLKPGDVVHMRAKIASVAESAQSFYVSLDGSGRGCWASVEHIVHIEPRKLAVGDKVKWVKWICGSEEITGVIAAMDDRGNVIVHAGEKTYFPRIEDLTPHNANR